jgi:hypothetical protein
MFFLVETGFLDQDGDGGNGWDAYRSGGEQLAGGCEPMIGE